MREAPGCNRTGMTLYREYNDKLLLPCYSEQRNKRTTGPERKGNAADPYTQFHKYKSPV